MWFVCVILHFDSHPQVHQVMPGLLFSIYTRLTGPSSAFPLPSKGPIQPPDTKPGSASSFTCPASAGGPSRRNSVVSGPRGTKHHDARYPSSPPRRAISSVALCALATALSMASARSLSSLRASFLARSAACAASLSWGVGTGGLWSMGGPQGAIMRLTTCRFVLDVRQPELMLTMSPVRRESFGSWTRCRSKCWKFCPWGKEMSSAIA